MYPFKKKGETLAVFYRECQYESNLKYLLLSCCAKRRIYIFQWLARFMTSFSKMRWCLFRIDSYNKQNILVISNLFSIIYSTIEKKKGLKGNLFLAKIVKYFMAVWRCRDFFTAAEHVLSSFGADFFKVSTGRSGVIGIAVRLKLVLY